MRAYKTFSVHTLTVCVFVCWFACARACSPMYIIIFATVTLYYKWGIRKWFVVFEWTDKIVMSRNENYYIYGLLCLCKFVYYLNAIQFCNETRHFNTYNAQQVHRVNKWERSLFANSFVFANVVYISYECCQNHYHSHSDQQFNTNIILPLSCDTVKIEYLFIFNIYSSRLEKKTTKCVYEL